MLMYSEGVFVLYLHVDDDMGMFHQTDCSQKRWMRSSPYDFQKQ